MWRSTRVVSLTLHLRVPQAHETHLVHELEAQQHDLLLTATRARTSADRAVVPD